MTKGYFVVKISLVFSIKSIKMFSIGKKNKEELKLNNKNTYQQEEKQNLFFELIKVFFISLLIIMPIRIFIFQPFFIDGSSMEPNFHDGEYLIINELGYKSKVMASNKEIMSVKRFKKFKRGDVVVFHYPLDPRQYFIKRIVGLPGETVEIKNEKIRIYNNDYPTGFNLEEGRYLPEENKTLGAIKFNLKKDEFVVLGDNRMHSSDSRSWGKLKGKFIVGKVLLRAWPISEAKIF